MTRELLLLRRNEVAEVLDMASCIEAVAQAFAAYSSGRAELPSVIHLDVPEHRGEIHVKAGHLHGLGHYAVKVASGFYANDPPAIDGLVVVFDARTGAPAAFLLEEGLLTDVRTGAAGGVAARHLAPATVDRVAVLGTGEQARRQLEALSVERPAYREVTVWGRRADRANATVRDIHGSWWLPEGCSVRVTGSPRETVEGAQVVITATASREPLVHADWLEPGAHVTAVGSDGADKQELDVEVLATADLVAVDSRAQTATIGELHHAVEVGRMSPSAAVELGEIVAGGHPGRTGEDQLTVCDLTGVGVQDVAAAALTLERATAAGLGERIRL